MQRLPDIHKTEISSAGIAYQFPYWFSTAFSKVTYLDVSNNSISGGLPANMETMSLKRLRLDSNQLFFKVNRRGKKPHTVLLLILCFKKSTSPDKRNQETRKGYKED